MDRNEKLEKARKKLHRYQKKRINSELHSNISEDDSRSLRSHSNSAVNSPLVSPRTLSRQSLRLNNSKEENVAKNTEQQTIQLLIEEKSDLITEREKLLFQIEQLKFEKKKQDDKLNEYLEQIKKYEEKENEFNKLSEENMNLNIEKKKELDSYITQNKELLDKINYQASIITDLTNENKSLSSKASKAEFERASSTENLSKLADDLEDKSKKLEDAMLEISTNLNTIEHWKDKFNKLEQQNQELKDQIKSIEEKDYSDSINTSLFIQSLLEYIHQIKNDNEVLKPILSNIYDVNTLNDTLELIRQLITIIQDLEIKIKENENQINRSQTNLEEQKKDQEEMQLIKSKLEQKEKEIEKMEKIMFEMNEKCESFKELLANEREIRAEKEEIIEEQTEAIEEMTEEAQQINTMRINLFKFIKLMNDLASYLVDHILKDDNSFDHIKILNAFKNIQKNDNIGRLNDAITEIDNSFNIILQSLKEFMEIKKIERLNSNSQININKVESPNSNTNKILSSKKNSTVEVKPAEFTSEPITQFEGKIISNTMKEKETETSNEDENIKELKEANILLRNKLADQQLVRDKLLEEIENVKQEAVQKSSELNINYEKALEDIKKERFKNNEYVTHMATMQEELNRLMNINDNLNQRQQQLEMDLEKMINDNLSMQSNTKNLKADKQKLLSKLSHEVHVNDLLSNEVNTLPDYILLYHKERKTLIEQNKKLIEKIKLLKEGKDISTDDLNEFISNAEGMSGNLIKFDSDNNSKERLDESIHNDNIDQLSIVNNSELSVPDEEIEKIYKSNDIFDNMDNVINDNVYDFTACRYCSSNLITL
jgi:hypothetical protein